MTGTGGSADPGALPEIDVETGPTVPAWSVRAVLVLLVLVVGVVASPTPGWWAVVAIAAGVVAVVPQVAVAGTVVAGAATLLLLGEPRYVASAVAVLGGHLLLVLARWTSAMPLRGSVEVALARGVAPRVAVVQVVSQALVLLAFAATGTVDRTAWLAVAALVGLLGSAALGLRMLRREPQRLPARRNGVEA